jgi:hypothetical protein
MEAKGASSRYGKGVGFYTDCHSVASLESANENLSYLTTTSIYWICRSDS